MTSIHFQLWMGNLEPYMSENFILAAFRKMGEDPTTVRLMRNKYTGELAGYCFVNFSSDEQALDAMHKLNGKPIPGTNPIVRFRLNSASNSYKIPGNERDFSIWVGDLSSDVDDYQLYKVFSAKYTSIKTAKVILDSSGFSKGYGFVHFGIEDEQKNALYEMNGFRGLGTKPIKICNAVPKPKNDLDSTDSYDYSTGQTGTDYSQYFDPATYWQGYNAWQSYYDQASNTNYYQQQQTHSNLQTLAQHAEAWKTQRSTQFEQQAESSSSGNSNDNDFDLIEHKYEVDVDKLNRETIDNDRLLYDALESSKWLPIEQLEEY